MSRQQFPFAFCNLPFIMAYLLYALLHSLYFLSCILLPSFIFKRRCNVRIGKLYECDYINNIFTNSVKAKLLGQIFYCINGWNEQHAKQLGSKCIQNDTFAQSYLRGKVRKSRHVVCVCVENNMANFLVYQPNKDRVTMFEDFLSF